MDSPVPPEGGIPYGGGAKIVRVWERANGGDAESLQADAVEAACGEPIQPACE